MSIFQRTYATRLRQLGFTLLELVLVLFLIGLLASAGLLFTENIESQQQYEETVERYERIRKAIIQSGERTVNDRPELSGFVVDMGRLPYCLAELITVEKSGTQFRSTCDNSVNIPKPRVRDGIHAGWHGPYIQVTPDSDGKRRFRDGYENTMTTDYSLNFGWFWELSESSVSNKEIFGLPIEASSPDANTLALRSYGFDPDDDSDDFPPINNSVFLKKEDWSVENLFDLELYTNSASAVSLDNSTQKWSVSVAISGAENRSYTEEIDISEYEDETLIDGNIITIPIEVVLDPSATVPGHLSDRIPAGFYKLNVTCERVPVSDPSDPCQQIKQISQPYTIQILPRHQVGPFKWQVAKSGT